MKGKILPLTAATLWLLGLLSAIVGLNIKNETGSWMTVIGSILFLIGLLLEGVIWFRKKKE